MQRVYKVCIEPFARGRLGHLYQAIECTTGTVVAIEDVEFVDADAAAAWMPTFASEINQ
ncbi:unnamed protein product, partial [Aphanomyces euteiches]